MNLTILTVLVPTLRFLGRFDLEVIIRKHELHLRVEILGKLQVLRRLVVHLFRRRFGGRWLFDDSLETLRWLVNQEIHLNALSLEQFTHLSLQLLHGRLLDHLVVLAELELLLKRVNFLRELILNFLSFSGHSSLLLIKLILQICYGLSLE